MHTMTCLCSLRHHIVSFNNESPTKQPHNVCCNCSGMASDKGWGGSVSFFAYCHFRHTSGNAFPISACLLNRAWRNHIPEVASESWVMHSCVMWIQSTPRTKVWNGLNGLPCPERARFHLSSQPSVIKVAIQVTKDSRGMSAADWSLNDTPLPQGLQRNYSPQV